MRRDFKKEFAAARQGRQGGFIQGAVLFGLLILSLVVGAFALANKGGSQNVSSEKDKVNAASVIKLGNDLRDAAFRFGSDYNLATMTMDTETATGLFDPAKGIISALTSPAGAMENNTAASFGYATTGYAVTNQGSSASEYALTLSGLSAGVCRQINRTLYGDAVNAAIPDAVGAREEGCYDAGTATPFTYYKVVQAN